MVSTKQTAPGRTPGSEAILAEARRGLMLVSLVERHIGADNLKKNGAYRYEANSAHCPACRREGMSPNALSIFVGKDGNWRWKCQSCGEGGTAIDWMIAVSGNMSVLEAARTQGTTKVVVALSAVSLYGDVPAREQPVKVVLVVPL